MCYTRAMLPTLAPLLPHLPTAESRDQVSLMVAIGLDTTQIAYLLSCTPSEVTLHYPCEVTHGLAQITAKVATALVRRAEEGDVNACKYWLEVRAKWKAPVEVKITAVLAPEERKSLLDTILGLVDVSPGAVGQLPAINAPSPGTRQ